MLETKELIDLNRELIEIKHKLNMEEIMAERENIKLRHEKCLEEIRIKSAEIRKSQMRKGEGGFKY